MHAMQGKTWSVNEIETQSVVVSFNLAGAKLDHNDACIAYDQIAVAGNIAGGCVLYEVCRLPTEPTGSGQHHHGRAEATHADFLLRDHAVESVRIKRKYALDRAMILYPSYRIGFIMIHIAGSDDQDWILL